MKDKQKTEIKALIEGWKHEMKNLAAGSTATMEVHDALQDPATKRIKNIQVSGEVMMWRAMALKECVDKLEAVLADA